MAQVAHDKHLLERIDHYLDYLLKTWEGVPLDAEEWASWDEFSRLNYDLDWGVPSDRLAQLRAFARRDLLTPEQRTRYESLELLVAQYQPLLDSMLAE